MYIYVYIEIICPCVTPEGRKLSSLMRRVRSQLARWKMTIARRCGAKHISKSRYTKHYSVKTLFAVAMSKQCMPLWHKAHFQVTIYNTQNKPCSDHFWRLRCWVSKKCTPLWRETHVEVKVYKAHHVRTTFGWVGHPDPSCRLRFYTWNGLFKRIGYIFLMK